MSQNLLRGELLRQRTTLAPWVILGIGVFMCVLMPYFMGYNLAQQYSADAADQTPTFVHDYVFSYAGRAGYFVPLLLGVFVVVADIREGAMSKLVTFSQGRQRALAVKTIVLILFCLLLAVVLTGANVLSGWLGMRAGSGAGEGILSGDIALMMLRTVAVFVLWAVLGMGLGMLIRSKVFAIVLVFIFALFVEPMLTSLTNENDAFASVGKFLPGALNWAIVWPVGDGTGVPTQASPLDPLPVLAALSCFGLYAASAYGLGALFGLVRRELPM